jgi:hypothetical protein
MRTLVELGDPAFDALVDTIHEAPAYGDAHEAVERLRFFGPRATYTLIEILRAGTEDEQDVALTGLWYCVTDSDFTEEEGRAVRAAVTPFLDNPKERLRTSASDVLKYLED